VSRLRAHRISARSLLRPRSPISRAIPVVIRDLSDAPRVEGRTPRASAPGRFGCGRTKARKRQARELVAALIKLQKGRRRQARQMGGAEKRSLAHHGRWHEGRRLSTASLMAARPNSVISIHLTVSWRSPASFVPRSTFAKPSTTNRPSISALKPCASMSVSVHPVGLRESNSRARRRSPIAEILDMVSARLVGSLQPKRGMGRGVGIGGRLLRTSRNLRARFKGA
jgi:hypothetical protein